MSKFKVGDIVTAKNYCGVLQIDWEDEMCKLILPNETNWMCSSIRFDTSFDVYSESDLQLATQEEIDEYLNYGK